MSTENETQGIDENVNSEAAVVATPAEPKPETRWQQHERLAVEHLGVRIRVDKLAEEANAINIAEHPHNVRRANEHHEAYLAELRHVQVHRATYEQLLKQSIATSERSAAALERVADALEDLTTKPGGAS
jgi:hypothetical protein